MLPQPDATGRGSFYRVMVDVILLFGMTEFTAQIAWRENVSGLYMSFKYRINFTRGAAWFLGERETVSFFKKKDRFFVELP